MSIEVMNKFVSPGYPMTCTCGEPTPCNADIREDGYPVVECKKCGESWTYYEMTGWSCDMRSAARNYREEVSTCTTEIRRYRTTEHRLEGMREK